VAEAGDPVRLQRAGRSATLEAGHPHKARATGRAQYDRSRAYPKIGLLEAKCWHVAGT